MQGVMPNEQMGPVLEAADCSFQNSGLQAPMGLSPKNGNNRIKSRDEFWQLAGIHLDYLYHVAIRYTGNQYDAEDLVQEIYFIAFKKFDQLRDPGKIKSWLFKILRNTYLKNRRQNGQSKKTE